MKPSKNLIIAIVVTALVAGMAGFGGGYLVGKSKSPKPGNFAQFGNMNGRNGTGTQATNRLRQGTGMVSGEILSKDDKSITVKDRTGGSKIIFFAPSTSIGKTTDGTKDDLKTGESVIVTGTANNDGSVTANNIQIRPAGAQDMPGFGGQRPNGGMMINGGNVPTPTNGQPNNL